MKDLATGHLGRALSDVYLRQKDVLVESGAVNVTLVLEDGNESRKRGHFILYRHPFTQKVGAAFTDSKLKIFAYGTTSPLPSNTSEERASDVMDKLEVIDVLHLDEWREAREFVFEAE